MDQYKVAFTQQTKVGKLVLANSSWCVWKTQQQLSNMLANCWRQIELVSILANFFTNFFVSVNSYLTCERLANVSCCPIKIRSLFTWFAWHFTKWRMSDRMKRHFNSWMKWSPVYKDTKNKQKKMEEIAQITFETCGIFCAKLLDERIVRAKG